MGTWKKIWDTLTSEPAGFRAADGRVLGLGLATAQENAKEQTASEVENYLREQDGVQRRTTTS